MGAGLAGLAAFSPVRAQTVDFEAPAYVVGNTMADVDGWIKSADIPLGTPDNFKIQTASGNKFVRSLTNGTSSISRPFADRGGVLDLRWRWRANGDSVHFCFGAEGNSGSLKISARAVACIDPSGGFEAQGLSDMGVPETWSKQTWYYMRLVMDPSLNKFTLYIANDSLRADERVAAPAATMAGVGPLGKVLLRNESGSGAVDVDDISWETPSIWLGQSDSNWTTGKNWSAGAVPDSLTHVIFNETSAKSCYLDKNGTAKSITMASAWKGVLNVGGSVLNVLGKADFTGGSYAGQPTGFVRLLAPKAQSVIGAESGRPAPPLRHEGAGLLRLDVRALFGSNLIQAQGRFDFNGFDVYLNGDLTVKNGQPGTFLNLDGRSIAVGHSARLDGTSKDTLLGLASTASGGGTLKGWSITPSDTLVARFAVIGNSRVGAITTGYAFGSSDAGGNTGWVFAAPPAILIAPKDVNAKPGEAATFRISAGSKLPAACQWLRDDKDIPNANDSTYALGSLTLAGNGAAFSCRVTNAAGSTTSAAARLIVTFPAPTPLPGPQEFTDSLAIILSPSVPGAKVYYSRNGSAYRESAGSFMLTDSTTLKAYAVLGADTSVVGNWAYPKHQLPQVEMPLISPDPLTFIDSQLVAMTPVTDGSSIHYTIDHSDPDSIKSPYTGPFEVKATTIVSARAYKTGYRPSPIRTNIYVRKGQDTASTLGRPHATPPGGTFTDSLPVTLTPPDAALDAALYYTFANGGLLKYYAPFNVRGTGTLKVIAIQGSRISDTASFAFTRRLEAPTATPKSRTFPDTLRIALTSKLPGESIYYTWDGSDPAGAKARPYPGSPILLDSSATLKAISVKGQDTSAILSETYTLIADTPQASYHGGDYSSRIQIQLKASTPRAVIYYTLDGATPGPENGRQPYTSAFSLDTTATLKAVAITGRGSTLQRSPLLVENYTFIVPGRRILNPGQRLDLSSNYSLTSPLTGGSQVIVDVLKVDSLNAIKGFRDIQFAIRLSLPEGSSAFPTVTFAAPNGEPRALYGLVPPSTVTYITDADSRDITAPGTYFLAVDTLPPQITLSGESFGADDSTRTVFTIQDNVSNLLLDLERTDIPARNISGKAIGSPEIVTAVLRNPAGSIQPLTIRISVNDHHQKASYPAEPGAYHFLAQKASGPARTPAVFRIGSDPQNLWDFISLPLAVDPPLTLTQLRKNNAAPGLEAATWDQASGKYRFLADDERMTPGASIWMAAPASMASMTFPTLATSPRMETGTYRLTLRKGWNQVANPTLAALFWPVTRTIPETYDQSPLKGLHGYDALNKRYVPADSLIPWRGYFAYYKGGRDTVIDLRFQPVPAVAPAPLAGGKSSAGAGAGLSLTFNLGSLPALRLGASAQAQDGIGYEDEPRPPSQNDQGRNDQDAGVWSARAGSRLETDIMHWSPGGLYAWRVIAGVTASTGAAIGSLRLPEGYSAWAVSRKRGLRFPLREGESLPLMPGFADSLDVYAGPSAELDARLAAIPLSVDAFRLDVSSAPGAFAFNLHLPRAARIHWTLWSIDGRIRETGSVNLPEGFYNMVRGASGSGFPPGMYVLGLDWAGIGGNGQPALDGRMTRKIAIP